MKGIKSYFTKGAFGAFNEYKSKYKYYEPGEANPEDETLATDYFIIITMISLSIIFGFLAVDKICPPTSERTKNIRLGMYGLLVLSCGMIGWIFILMWVLNIRLD
jgi:hypothetical protein